MGTSEESVGEWSLVQGDKGGTEDGALGTGDKTMATEGAGAVKEVAAIAN